MEGEENEVKVKAKKPGKKKGGSRRSIKQQLILIMAALVAVPLAIAIIFSVVNTRSEGIESAEEINAVQAHLIETSIKDILDQNVQVMQTFAAAPSTIEFIEGGGSDEELKAEIYDQMLDIDANLADGNATIITDPDGQQILRTVGDTVNVADREYFKKAMEGTVYVSDIEVSKATGNRITTFAVPVFNEDESKVVGIVQRNYNLSDFHDLIASEITEEKQEIVMVDRTGSVIAHSGHEIDPNAPEDQSMNPFYTDSRGETASGSYESNWQGETWMISWVKEAQTGWVVASCRVQSVALKHVTTMTFVMILIGVIFLVVGIIVAFWQADSFIKPVQVLNSSLAELAEGNFVEIDKYTNRNDEFGEMINETNTVIDKIKSVVTDLKEVMSRLGESSQSLAETSGQISQTADDVSEAVQEIAKGATEQADTIQKATENITTLSDAIQNVANNAEGLASTATSMNDSSTSSAEALRELSSNMDSMNHAMNEISEGMNATNAAVQGVNERVDGITSIASQTNLLALNASIEAARAGEAGRGFAVVAEEIGKLATESAQTAEEIRAEMAKLLTQSQNAIKMTSEVSDISGNVNTVLTDTVDKINELIDGVGTTVDGVTTISGLSQESAASKTIIVDAMDSLSAISEENAASTQQTSASMQELNATVNVLSQSASDLNDLAKKLEEDLDFFKL